MLVGRDNIMQMFVLVLVIWSLLVESSASGIDCVIALPPGCTLLLFLL